MIGAPPPNRDRFLCAIAERVSPDRVQAVFLFPPIRQGPVETCVAVLAVEPLADGVAVQGVAGVQGDNENGDNRESVSQEGDKLEGDNGEDDVQEELPEASPDDPSDAPLPETVPASRFPLPSSKPVVLTAQYRHTLKGPDRGKWELEILEQADAPLVTIETVVRGVQARLDDQAEPERLGADELRSALAEGVWTAPAR